MRWALNSSVVVLTIGLILASIGSARAQDDGGQSHASLKGTFRFSLVKTCTDAVIGSTTQFYFNGTMVYDGSGSVKLAQQGTLIIPGSTALVFEEMGELTYLLKPNGNYLQEGTIIGTDHSYTVTGARLMGQIDAQGSVLMLNGPIPPERETVTSSGGGVSQYVCGASGTAVRLR